ncbi:hypothetical protein [Labilibaculum antarcticum]|uniref:Uncharacterized protein n=1 Tax=Labilibaculum antarcticum TaxID=1717717 RepID=A0A1Y1CKC0_9BACT|nr:hypothetical protein [Labilibaculum antarcticum]BAX80839.1 hypothetical protein ALGA_2517 [Labilibaculum antarcticum]
MKYILAVLLALGFIACSSNKENNELINKIIEDSKSKDVSSTIVRYLIKEDIELQTISKALGCNVSLLYSINEDKVKLNEQASDKIFVLFQGYLDDGNEIFEKYEKYRNTNKIIPDHQWLTEFSKIDKIPREEALLRIEMFRNVEHRKHLEFVSELKATSLEYFKHQVDILVDEEFSIFSWLGELKDLCFLDQKERRAKWGERTKEYFNPINYYTKLQNNITIYNNQINDQRKLNISRVIGTKHKNTIKNKLLNVSGFQMENKVIDAIIEKSDNYSFMSLSETILDFITGYIVVGIIFLLGFLGLKIHPLWVSGPLWVISIGGFIYFGIKNEQKIRDSINSQIEKIHQEQDFNFFDKFDQSTDVYYNTMIDIVMVNHEYELKTEEYQNQIEKIISSSEE